MRLVVSGCGAGCSVHVGERSTPPGRWVLGGNDDPAGAMNDAFSSAWWGWPEGAWSFPRSPFRLLCVGGEFGEAWKEVSELAGELGFADGVCWKGFWGCLLEVLRDQ